MFGEVGFTCFGLGDREYFDTYCQFSRYVGKRMLKHGAQVFYELGEGDSSVDIDMDFEDWKMGLFDHLKTLTLTRDATPEEERAILKA